MSVRRKKQSEPFVQISSIILNSAAYQDLSFSARSMLIELLHFFNGRNNGYVFISKNVLKARGFSKNTATKSLKELTTHGFIYMTRRGGNINGGCSWYALTWLPINRIEGQHLENYVANAFAKWQPLKKIDGSKLGSPLHQKMGKGCFESSDKNFEPHINQAIRLRQLISINPNFCDL